MAYNNYYNPYQGVQAPMDRLQMLQQPYQMPQQAQTGQILWVQGEAAAKAYLVAPGTSVLLMDSDQSAFYIKTVDNAGMPMPLRTFRYEEVNGTPTPTAGDVQYVTRAEYEDLAGKYNEIIRRLEALNKEENNESNL